MNMKKFAALALALVMCLSMAVASAEAFETTVDWNAEYDVVVIGYGAAGATAAVSAVETGAEKVLILEKAPYGHEGGNSRYAAQLVLSPVDKENAMTYYKLLRGNFDNQNDEILEGLVDGLLSNRAWFDAHGAKYIEYPVIEYPELEGNESMVTLLLDAEIWTGAYYRFMQGRVAGYEDKIDIWYETPGVRLIQDKTTRIVHGVMAENNGQKVNIRAKNGVVMAMGGFENNDEMLENYCQLSNAYSKGARYNDGDGIKMAIDVGADLWHMSTLSGNDVNFVNPETGISAGYLVTGSSAGVHATMFAEHPMIIIGGDGTRFMDETATTRHGHTYQSGTWFTQVVPENSWCVFDQTAYLADKPYPTWSDGLTEEMEKGWVIKADTLEELAAMMNVPVDRFMSEVELYNGYCEAGKDMEFANHEETHPEFLKKIETAPYYAFQVKSTMTNTQGGAKRNVKCEVVDVWNEPIPHLYGAGEFGSFYTDIYNGGGNLGECVFTGRIAGENAAAVKTDVMQESVMEGKTAVDFSQVKAVYETAANEYIGVASGMGDNLTVKVTMEGDKIAAIEILSHNETPGLSDNVIAQMPGKIVEAQTTEVDNISGATLTSKGIKAAVADALSQIK